MVPLPRLTGLPFHLLYADFAQVLPKIRRKARNRAPGRLAKSTARRPESRYHQAFAEFGATCQNGSESLIVGNL